MSFTRFHDDPCRIKKQLQESTGPGRYILNQPGWGDSPCYMEDPYVRMQQWGANLRTNTINLESDLIGLSRPLNRDCQSNNYLKTTVPNEAIQYPTCKSYTDQSRVTDPAWRFRDLEQVNWAILPLNPQENTCIPFQYNLDTRLLEKDHFVAQAPCVKKNDNKPLYSKPFANHSDVTNCIKTNNCGSV